MRKVLYVLAAGALVFTLAGCGAESEPTAGRTHSTTTERAVSGVCCGNPEGETETPDATVTSDSPQALFVTALVDDNGTRRRIKIDVLVGPAVVAATTHWHVKQSSACENDGVSLVLTSTADGREVRIGNRCAWADAPGPFSPDGRMLVAWKPWDGAASRIHLIDLSTSPHDLGEVPHSQTTSYTAVWTRDNRLWFTYDGSPDGDDKLWSYRAGESRSTPTDVPGAVLVEAVAAE